MAKYKIIPSSRTIVQSPISIGHKAEKGVEAIEFDLTAWVETYGSGTLTVIMRRWGDAIPYPIALEIDENNKATWTLSDTDTAKAGMAYAQLSYIVGDEVVKKSDIYTFRVMDSLTGEGDPPEAYESWLEHLTHFAAEAMAEVLDIEGIVTDKTLTVDGGIADGKATGDALALKADKSTTYTKTEVDQMIEDVEVETDTTLEIAGAPADAKKVGDELSDIKADLGAQTGVISLIKDYYIKTSDTPIDLTPMSSSAGRMYAVVDCTAGDKFVINAYSDSSVARAWCFIDSANNAISMAEILVDVTDLELTAPNNAAKLIINDMRGGMSYKVGNNLASRVSEIAFSNDAKVALLACFKHVAWTDKHGQDYYDALESALYKSGSYWDYEWHVSSGALPEGMTADAYDFTTEVGSLYVVNPVIDFNYIGNGMLLIEGRFFTTGANDVMLYDQNNPQITITNQEPSSGNYRGLKVVTSSSLNPENPKAHNMVAVGINGINTLIDGVYGDAYHIYDISAIDNTYSLKIDDVDIPITQNQNTTPYLGPTGINASNPPGDVKYKACIKSIKFKRLP